MKIFIYIYVIFTALVAIISTILEVQPALFIIDIFAPNEGDEYNLLLVFLLTWLVFLLPVVIYLYIAVLIRKKDDEIVAPDRTGIFVTRVKAFQSALVGIPFYINDQKSGIIDNGRTKFFDTSTDTFTIKAGDGKQASDNLQIKIEDGKQLHFEIRIIQAGLGLKIVLRQLQK